MKKIGLLFLLFSFVQASIFAQSKREEMMGKLESQRVAFISDKLQLTSEDAQLFWPIHNEYQAALKELRDTDHRRGDFLNASEADAEEMLNKMIEKEGQVLAVKKEYAMKIKDVIGAKRTMIYFGAERQFKEEIIGSLRKRRHKQSDRGN